MLFEIYRRAELIMYLAQQFQCKRMKMFKIVPTNT